MRRTISQLQQAIDCLKEERSCRYGVDPKTGLCRKKPRRAKYPYYYGQFVDAEPETVLLKRANPVEPKYNKIETGDGFVYRGYKDADNLKRLQHWLSDPLRFTNAVAGWTAQKKRT